VCRHELTRVRAVCLRALQWDVVAGVSVAFMLVPQGMS
jgi:MFS superfamily sulfate permease-like transporter